MSDHDVSIIRSPEGRAYRVVRQDGSLVIYSPRAEHYKWHALLFVAGVALIAWKYDSLAGISGGFEAFSSLGLLALLGGVVCIAVAAVLALLERFAAYVVVIDNLGISSHYEIRERRILSTGIGFNEFTELRSVDHGKDARIQVHAVDSKDPRFSIGRFISSKERDWFLGAVSDSMGLGTGGHVDSDVIGEMLKGAFEPHEEMPACRTTPGSDTSPALKLAGLMLAGASFLFVLVDGSQSWPDQPLEGIIILVGMAAAMCVCGAYIMSPTSFARQGPDGSLHGWYRAMLVFRRQYHIPAPTINKGECMGPERGA